MSNVGIDIVAVFGNNVEQNFVLSTKSKQIEHIQFVSTLTKGRIFTKNSFDIVAKTTAVSELIDRAYFVVLFRLSRHLYLLTSIRNLNDLC